MELDVDTKKTIIASRINKLASDRYQIELNHKFSLEQNNEEAVQQYKAALDSTDQAIEFHKKELAALDA